VSGGKTALEIADAIVRKTWLENGPPRSLRERIAAALDAERAAATAREGELRATISRQAGELARLGAVETAARHACERNGDVLRGELAYNRERMSSAGLQQLRNRFDEALADLQSKIDQQAPGERRDGDDDGQPDVG
jgi:hypothetical protein